MKEALSKVIFGLSWTVAFLTFGATGVFIYFVLMRDPFGSLFFLACVAPSLGAFCLLLSLIPSGILFFRWRQRRDLRSLSLSSLSLLVLLGETIAMHYLLRSG